MCQELSEEFIREFKDVIKWNTYIVCNKSEEFVREFTERFDSF